MGNTSVKQQTYQQYYENMQNTNEHIDLDSLDPYKVLNVSKNFTWRELKEAYQQAALKTHPDKNNGDDTEFKKINLAYETLSDQQKRKEYDKLLM